MFTNHYGRLLRPGWIGFLAGFFAFLAPGVFDTALSLFFPSNEISATIWKVISLHIAVAGLLSIIFYLFYIANVVVAASFSRLEKYWNPAGPGIFLFVVLIEPLGRYVLQMESGADLRIPIFGFLSLLVAMGVLYIFPIFRGYNVTFLVAASLLVRYALPALVSMEPHSESGSFLLYHLISILLVGMIFLLLQQRHRLKLSSGYESILTPTSYLLGGSLILFALIFLIGLKANSSPIAISFDLAVLLLFSSLVLFWLILAIGTNLINYFHLYQSAPVFLFPFLLLVFTIFTAGLAESLSMWNLPPPKNAIFTRNILETAGKSFDWDRDGSSFWPGMDPDDSNRCKRIGFDPCGPSSPGSVHMNENSHDQFTLLTFDLPISHFSPDSLTGNDVYDTQMILPSNDPGENLHALLHMRNRTFPESENESLFSLLAMQGYRTICSVESPMENLTDRDSPYHLDDGCQVLETFSTDAKSHPHRTLLLFARYREKQAVYWMHQQESDAQDDEWLENLNQLILRQRKLGPVMLLLMNTEKSPEAHVYLAGKLQEPGTKKKKGFEEETETPLKKPEEDLFSFLEAGLGGSIQPPTGAFIGSYRKTGEAPFSRPDTIYTFADNNSNRIDYLRSSTGYRAHQLEWPRSFY